MKASEIITKAITELQWAEAKLAATGYPGVAEVEQSVKRAMAHLREKAEAEVPALPSDDPGPFYLQLADHIKKVGPQVVSLSADGTLDVQPVPAPQPDGLAPIMERAKTEGPQVVSVGADGTVKVETVSEA